MIKGLILSLQFFTRIPINISIDFDRKNIKYGVFFLPIVGMIIGGSGGLIYWIIQPYNKLIAGFLALLTSIILTGGLHLDGLSDTFDGFYSNQDKNKTLEIMKDSRLGAFGVLSIVLLILFKFLLIISIERVVLSMTLSFLNSRLVVGRIISYKKAAKAEGLGNIFHNSSPKKLVNIFIVIYVLILISINILYIIPLLITFILGEYISVLSYEKIGGLTGDVHGAIIELGDAISLFGFWSVMIWI